MSLKIPKKTSAHVRDGIIQLLGALPPELVRSVTPDRGKEFAKHDEISAALNRPPQNIRTAQKGPYVRKKGSGGVAKRERSHSEFCLDALVVVEVDIAVDHGVGFA